MGDAPMPVDSRAGLRNFRRYTWWSLMGSTESFLILLTARWVLEEQAPVVARAGLGIALPVVVVVSAVLFTHRLANPAQNDMARDQPTRDRPARERAVRDRPARPRLMRKPAVRDRPARERPRRRRWVPQDGEMPVGWLVAGGGAAALGGAILLGQRDYAGWALAPATMVAVTAMFLPPGRRWRVVAVAAAVAALPGGLVSALSGDDVRYGAGFPAGLVAFVAWVTLGMMWSWDVAERLNAARRMAADLAIKDERLRFAADLHDIQGHHLQVIALKSELATRLAHADPVRAAAEMEEVRRLAADALRDTRAVVHGYRRTSLDAEIANATKVLAAAGVDASMRAEDTGALPDGGRHLLGLVMRESTTNVLRHSRARRAEVVFRVRDGFAILRVGNDGVPAPEADGGAGPITDGSAGGGATAITGSSADGGATAITGGSAVGGGLRSLAARLEAAGGGLVWEHKDDGFVVEARLPAGTEER